MRGEARAGGPVFWKITGAGAAFQAGSSAVDSATIVASLVNHLTGSVYAVGAAIADALSLEAVFAVALCAAALQIALYVRLARWEAA